VAFEPSEETTALAVSADFSTFIHATINGVYANKTKCEAGMLAYRGGDEMIRPAERYRQIADNYDRLALDISDQTLRWVYLDFAQQWRAAAARAEAVDIKNAPQELQLRRWGVTRVD
jgi:hypothetical protein